MEENREELETTPAKTPEETPVPEKEAYVPRPGWQVMAARIGLVVFLILLALYYGVMFFGGGK